MHVHKNVWISNEISWKCAHWSNWWFNSGTDGGSGLTGELKEIWAPSQYSKDVFSKDLVKSRSHEIGTLNSRIALKFDRHIGSTAAEVPVEFQSDRTILNTNLAASRLYEILRKDVFSDIETGPWSWYTTPFTTHIEVSIDVCILTCLHKDLWSTQILH